jgi:hypothetical protein
MALQLRRLKRLVVAQIQKSWTADARVSSWPAPGELTASKVCPSGRGAISSRLMRYRDQNGQGWADIIDTFTIGCGDGGSSCWPR